MLLRTEVLARPLAAPVRTAARRQGLQGCSINGCIDSDILLVMYEAKADSIQPSASPTKAFAGLEDS